MTKQEKDKAFIRSAGEHYVLARIAKELAIPAGLAPENSKDIDILAIYPNCDSPIRIQVKTRTEGNSPDNGWMMSQKHEEICDKDLFYVFVTLPEKWTDECQPKTYIMPAEKVAQILKKTHQDWLKTPGQRGQPHQDTNMRRIKPIYNESPDIPSNWLEQYKDKWELLKK
ncbi:hypothetical protein [Candidatus Avelusimicrobium faecicola]|uniref:hypothetical protein n=1 Tax=Candidatus Avelusimicrobium faecicola TaxID=3416205 RepID=UPI003D150101